MNITDVVWSPWDIPLRSSPGNEWENTETVTLRFHADGKPNVLHRGTGALVNGASVPRAFWRVAGPPMASLTVPGMFWHDTAFEERFLVNGNRITFEQSADLYDAINKVQYERERAKGRWGWAKRKLIASQLRWHSIGVNSPFARKIWNSHNERFGP